MAHKIFCKKCVNSILLKIVVFIYIIGMTASHLNLYIFQEDLKKDLDLDFGIDMYLVTDGEPAPLLLKPESFYALVAPLPSTMNRLCFRWNSYPLDENQHIRYMIRLSSSDVDVMPVPKVTTPTSSVVPLYEHEDSGFKLLFPCSGLKEGIVDLGFHLNYTADGFNEGKHLDVVVRRHCVKRGILTNISRAVHEASSNSMQNLVIGLSVAITVLIIILLFCIVNCQLQKRKRELQIKFDYHYEMIMKNKEIGLKEDDSERNAKVDIDLLESEELMSNDTDHNSTPIFAPKTTNPKWRSNNRNGRHSKHKWIDNTRMPYCTSSLPNDLKLTSQFGLEKILEEENPDTNNCFKPESEKSGPFCNHAFVTSGIDPERPEINGTATCINDDGITNSEIRSDEYDADCDCNLHNTDDHTCSSSNSNGDVRKRTKEHICVCNNKRHNRKKEKEKLVNKRHCNNFLRDTDGCNTVPMHRKTNLNKPSKNVREGGEINVLNAREKRLQGIYQYMNRKWIKQFQDQLIPQQRVIMGKHPLGKGASSNVHHGKLRSLDSDENITLMPVALKTLTSAPDNCECITKFFTEAYMMGRLNHKNIMPLLGVMLQNNKSPVIMMPYLKSADLNQFLRNARGTPKRHQALSTRQLINFGAQIACGMEYLASVKYVHRDLSTRNCMVGENLEVKISNLGLARNVSKENYRMSRKTRLPIKWMASECLVHFVFSEKSDVWSYGVVLWEIINMGKQPYSGLDNQDMLEYLQQGHRLERTKICPEDLYHLMSLCWIDSPHDRPSFQQLHKEISECEAKYQRYCIQYNSNNVVT